MKCFAKQTRLDRPFPYNTTLRIALGLRRCLCEYHTNNMHSKTQADAGCYHAPSSGGTHRLMCVWHLQVCRSLIELGINFELEKFLADGCHTVDIVLRIPGKPR